MSLPGHVRLNSRRSSLCEWGLKISSPLAVNGYSKSIKRRPAIGREVAHQQHVDLHDAADGITPVVRAPEIGNVIAGFLELPGVAARQDAGARGRALGFVRLDANKEQPLARHLVESRRLDAHWQP